jgi:hypothetical protein
MTTNPFSILSEINIDWDLISTSSFAPSDSMTQNQLEHIRKNNAPKFKAVMEDHKIRYNLYTGLALQTNDKSPIKYSLIDIRNLYLVEYYRASYLYFKELVIANINSINNTKGRFAVGKFVQESQAMIDSLESLKNQASEESKVLWQRRIDEIKLQSVDYVGLVEFFNAIENSTWEPPNINQIKEIADNENLKYSEALEKFMLINNGLHLIPDWLFALSEYVMSKNGRDGKASDAINLSNATVYLTENYNPEKVASNMFNAVNMCWLQMTYGIKEIEESYIKGTLNNFIKQVYIPFYSHPANLTSINPDFYQDQAMGGFFKKIFRGIVDAIKAPIKYVAKPVLEPVFKAVGAEKYLPFDMINKLYDIPMDMATRLATLIEKPSLRNAIEVAKIPATATARMNSVLIDEARKYGPVNQMDKWTGGLLASYERLNEVNIVYIESEGKAEINWALVAFDLIKIGAVAMAGGGAIQMLSQGAYQGLVTETGLANSNNELVKVAVLSGGAFVGSASAGLASGSSMAVSSVAQQSVVQGSSMYATDRAGNVLVKETPLGKSETGRTFASLGAELTGKAVLASGGQGNFSQEAQKTALNKVNEVALAKASEKVGVDPKLTLEILGEAKALYDGRVNEGYIADKAKAEADRFVAKRMDEAYGTIEKYGEDFALYLMNKFGLLPDYDQVIVPEDFYAYQLFVVKQGQSFLTIDYTQSRKKLYLTIGGILALAGFYYLIEE